MCARCFRLCDGSRSLTSNKQRQREVARNLPVNFTDYGYAAKRQIADDIANAAHNPNHKIAMGVFDRRQERAQPDECLKGVNYR